MDDDLQPIAPFTFELTAPVEPPPRKRRTALIVSLAVGVPLLAAAGVFAFLLLSGAFADREPPQLTATQAGRIQDEVAEREDLLAQLDDKRSEFRTAMLQWDQSVSWAEDAHGPADQPTVAVANPGGDALPGDDPTGRAFLDSIGATDVSVVFDAGPDNCGYYGNGGQSDFVYAGGCFRGDYANTLYMAWDSGAEDLVWSIFVHEAMHWFQAEKYAQATYLADFAGIDEAAYDDKWEADASCRAVYVYGISIDEYVDSSSPCTIDGWYEGWISDYLTSLGADLAEPDPTAYELAETSRP
ncbi:MAG: hypothetical protein JWR04_1246 [Rhodoglobus sp.]|nr:hypothetical protein [Rhodoglobus sp.]